MAYLTLHRLYGKPAELLERKRKHYDPVVRSAAREHGAVLSVTARTPQGLVVINVWESPEGATAFMKTPEVAQALRAAGLPMPSASERHPEADVEDYRDR